MVSPFAARSADPGDRIDYQITGRNTGGTVLDPVTITDDLSDVLDDASIVVGPAAWIDGVRASDPVIDGTTLRWSGRLEPEQTVDITYTVLVDADAAGQVLRNTASGVAQPPGSAPIREESSVVTPIRTAGFTFDKQSVPASGSTVSPGDEISYTLSARNTGEAPLDPVTISDELDDVLDDASLTGPPVATIDGEPTTDPVLDGTTLRWTGPLNAGERLTIRYTVTVHDDAAGVTFANAATATATPPSGFPPLEPVERSTTHPVPAPGFALEKSAVPASGSTVDPGQEIRYTVTGRNTGATTLDPVRVTDDLTEVLDAAAMVGQPVATIDGEAADAPVLDGNRLRWSGALPVGSSVTIEYTVRVDDGAAGAEFRNHATASAQPPGSATAIVPPAVETDHQVPRPAFDLAKGATPASGSSVDPGQTISYVVTGTNSGETELAVALRDDLSNVLAHATLSAGPSATVDGAPAADPVLDGTTLTWSGTLQPEQVVRLSYTVTVNQDAAGVELENLATGSARPPGSGPAIDPGEHATSHAVPVPGFELAKSADPVSGTEVHPGGTITYTVTGENTGQTRLDPVDVVDDLGAVLDHATMAGAPTARIDGTPTTAPTLDGTALRWRGALEPGQTVTITYSVTVSADAAGERLENRASGTAAPPGGPALTAPEVQTFHPVPEPALELRKRATPPSGSTVAPGGQITYVVAAENTGETVLDPVTILDDLSEVLNSAELTGTPSAEIDGAPAAAPTLDGDTLRWTGRLERGQTVTLRYMVTVSPEAAGATLRNAVTATAQPPGSGAALESGPRETTHRVPTPSYEFAKTAQPASGSTMDPGGRIEYVLTGRNTGETRLDPVAITDDLAEVLANATITSDPIATIDGEPTAMPTVEGTTLRWSGDLDPDQTVEIRYTVTVHDDAAGATLRNRATSTAQPPGTGPALVPPAQETTHEVPTPSYEFTKAADPASGTSVNPGDEIEYTLAGRNTGETGLQVAIEDELAEVLAHATISEAPIATIDGEPAAAPTVQGTTLRWSGALRPEQTVEIRYTVTVHDDAAGSNLRNRATSTAQPPGTGPALVPEPRETTHPVPTPGYTFAKRAEPASGTSVNPGAEIEYTLTGRNTGETPLDPVAITDELAEVLADATITSDPIATIDGAPATAPTVDGTTLRWSGALRPEQTVEIRYTVTVHDDAAGATLRNHARSTAQPPGTGPALSPPPQETTHPVPVPGFTLGKVADPASGSAVHPGERISYTITGRNTGATPLDPVRISDELGGVLGNAALDGAPLATVDGEPAAAPVVDGSTLSWTGSLQRGQVVTIRYTVTVAEDAAGSSLRNLVTGTAQPPGTGPAVDGGRHETVHAVPVPGFELSKAADPASGSVVHPGRTVTYTLTGENTGETVLDPVAIRDELGEVLAHGALRGSPVATVDGEDAPAPTLDGTVLNWSGALRAGQTVTIRYTVVVGQDAAGVTLRNSASGTAIPPGGPALDAPEVATSHEVPVSGYDLTKSATPADGSVVSPGEQVRYTLTGVNTGETLLDPVEIRDDLSQVLADAELSGEPTATIDGAPAPAPRVEGAQLSWSGALEPGQRVEITYTVTVSDEAAGRLRNTATSTATPPGGPRIESGERSTSHPIPAIELAKRAELTGTGVAGDVIDYTFTITNTGGTRLDDVVLRDPLPGLGELRYAWPDPGAPGVLEIGQTATASASYTLTQADVDAGSVRNTATVTGTPPGDGTLLVTDEDGTSTPAEQRPAIALEKTGRASGDRAGDLVEFRFLVTNTGTVTLREVAIDDPLPGLSALRFVWPDASAPGVLAPGESATATASYRLTAADVERGRVHNVASATGTPPGSLTPPRASDDATVAVGGLPATGVSLGTGVLAAFLLAAGALLLPVRRRGSVRRAEE
ncbi:hypothetical protein [Agromyces sp. NBRC 114283]|uniref:DUF7927 domain-containing protein n=1 Tax=Agromyces sp. NBRC 114283 TaxID=2994521 RepID=UPI0024A1C07A|nr:hypothetical protein [Agromyces sp. NBRC 114283]GLU90300.1 hypothetical protein Agsp01_25550 [Agromyces sp. NBRC 114283]